MKPSRAAATKKKTKKKVSAKAAATKKKTKKKVSSKATTTKIKTKKKVSRFIVGMFAGCAVAVGAAQFYPWVDNPRSVPLTVVLHNGGRAEDFVIYFPIDRIASLGGSEMGLRAKAYPDGVDVPAEIAAHPVLVEHFKLRDREGEVIGVAVRHASVVEDDAASAWVLTIPGRGTMHLLGHADPGALDRALASEGQIEGRPWSGDLEWSAGGGGDESGLVVGGNDEFAGLLGTYKEDWLISGVNPAGELRGTIILRTISEVVE